MAERKVVLPSPRAPVVDKSGRIDPTWYRFLVDLYERTGGGALDKVEETTVIAAGADSAAATAQAAATTAQTAAATAQTAADSVTSDFDDLDNPSVGVALDGDLGFYGATPSSKPTVTGSRAGNAALTDLITKLETLGILSDSTS